MRYLLDTNILSELIKKSPNPHLMARLRKQSGESLSTSSVCVMEMRYGSALRNDSATFWQKVTEEILSRVSILSLGYEEAMVAGDILAKLQRTGQMIGVEDILIAATAMHHGCNVVTGNIRHFGRIEGLRVENWFEPS